MCVDECPQPVELVADPAIAEQLSPLRGGIVKATLTAITRGAPVPVPMSDASRHGIGIGMTTHMHDGDDADDGRLLRAVVLSVEPAPNLPDKTSMRRLPARRTMRTLNGNDAGSDEGDGGAGDNAGVGGEGAGVTEGRSILVVRVVIGVKGPDYCDEDCVTRVFWTGERNLDSLLNHISYGEVRLPRRHGAVATIALDHRDPRKQHPACDWHQPPPSAFFSSPPTSF